MSTASKIEWTEQTWNPVTGCDKVSPGCKNCYAETLARRLQAMGVPGYEKAFRVATHENRLQEPLNRKKPTVYFVNSMSDLFHPEVPNTFLGRVFDVMERASHHTFQVLTKRPERMLQFCSNITVSPNVWLGVSVENRQHGIPRIAQLRRVRAKVRFLSVEPLLEDLGALDLRGIDWVIVGGESGPNARPISKSWIEAIQSQCQRDNIPFFFKQWGRWGADGIRRSKKQNGRLLNGKTFDDLPLLRQ